MDQESRSFSKFLIIFVANDNHVSNVNTLQSIFKQEYPILSLVILNDDTNAFQCERLMWNITDHIPENIEKIQIVENRYPIGEPVSVRNIIRKSNAEYVMILHSGERFSSAQVLNKCWDALEQEPDTGILTAPVEERSADLKKVIKKHIFDTVSDTSSENRDAMYIYRLDILRGMLEEAAKRNVHVCDSISSVLPEESVRRMALDFSLCIFTPKELEDTPSEVPQILGNEKLQNIKKLMEEHKSNPTAPRPVHRDTTPAPSQKNKRILWAFKNSRFLRIKTNILIDLLLIFFAVLFYTEKILPPAWCVFAAAGVLLTLWIIVMLACNLYFRKHPERLVF
ncbi:MAG: hypothetical protein K5739_06850 [Lachnospiraceae bacterium]|nr:hypothetical protein [Lachnospiraceae bacterium]